MNKIRLVVFACISSLLLVAIAFPSPVVKGNSKVAKAFKQVAQVGPSIFPANCMARLTAFACPQFGMERCWCLLMAIATKPTIRAKWIIETLMWRRTQRSKLRYSRRGSPLPVPPIATMAGKSRAEFTTRKT